MRGMKLYEGWRSSASWRVRWALALKGVPYESVLVDLDKGENQTVLVGLNPLRTVPTLELDDGETITDSVAIIEWLDETRPEPPLMSADAMERARIRSLVQLVTAGIHPLQNTSVRKAISSDHDAQSAWCRRFIERGLSAYEGHLAHNTGRFSVGDRLTMADLFLVPQVRNADRWSADTRALARVRAIYDTCLAMPEVKATHPDEVRKRVK
jgi:maleylacetoacetate isomerase